MKIIYSSLIIVLSLLFTSCKTQTNGSKIGVVDLPLIYTSFDYQKELNEEFISISKFYEGKLDSLESSLSLLELNLKNNELISEEDKSITFEREYLDFVQKKDYLAFQKDSISNSFSEITWKQLNGYIKNFGEENDYEVIVGMQGNGNVMYVKDKINITNSIIEYVNKEYNGE